ncbi:superinfection immunity protein [Micromonospora sp. STR1s_5]|nr:superinfection immunity protein [Micromonospora sp. STR1s_5]
MKEDLFALVIMTGVIGFCVLYVLPSIIAFRRQHPNRWLILGLNVFLGETGILWVVALVWALRAAHRPIDPVASQGGESGLNLFVNDIKPVRLVGPTDAGLGPNMTAAGRSASVIDELERLSSLRMEGNLTEQEFDALKASALGRN